MQVNHGDVEKVLSDSRFFLKGSKPSLSKKVSELFVVEPSLIGLWTKKSDYSGEAFYANEELQSTEATKFSGVLWAVERGYDDLVHYATFWCVDGKVVRYATSELYDPMDE